ncbi:DUF2059 domain-containing protein [uncultured Rhodoblastus sp.]|uniref:DUF2059 domain-containing protein n=1 Tax=uncultured Rhodoblastus sp. TaxID=543037 RepID=UPI0025E17FFF|nr:DUF2059 domain-containing protein [uncultured Rhodoblastus sp.]
MLRPVARLFFCGLFFAAAGPARAQETQASQAPEPDSLRLARLVVVDSGLARSFRGLVEQMSQDLRNRAAATRPEAVADLNAALAELQPEFDALAETMTDRAAALYAARLSRRELADVAVFFAGPSGKAYVAAQPALIGDLAAALAEWRRDASVTTMTRVREKMREKGREF